VHLRGKSKKTPKIVNDKRGEKRNAKRSYGKGRNNEGGGAGMRPDGKAWASGGGGTTTQIFNEQSSSVGEGSQLFQVRKAHLKKGLFF